MTASAAVLAAIPHRPPFLFVNEIVEIGPKRIVTKANSDPEADFFRGHYPGEPVMPGVLLCECCFQAGALLIAHVMGKEQASRGIPVLTRIADARFKHIVRPGDVLTAEVTLDEELDGAYFLTGRLSANERHALRVTFACMLALAPGAAAVSFLNLGGKVFVVLGIANKRSVAYRIALLLLDEGAIVIASVRSEARRESVSKLLPDCDVHVCDVEHDDQIAALAGAVRKKHPVVHGLLHSIAFADYENFSGKFHEVSRTDFLRCVSISCYSFIALANAFKEFLDPQASAVTISISTTRMAVESYGYMAPAKAALDSSVAFLAKAFSRFSQVRFNAVSAGLLKTSASAGIPGYIDHYMFAEQAIPRKSGLTTDEVANAALFLLSERSSGVNAQCVVVDAGMDINYFDADIVRNTLKGIWPIDKP